MSKEVDWGHIHGEGEIVCTCDECGEEYRIEFFDSNIDYREAQKEIEKECWQKARMNGEWYDFCTMECRHDYIRKNL